MTDQNLAPIFIGGAPRSGTTLLRVILDSHSRIYCGPELRVVPALANLSSAAMTSAPLLAHAYSLSADEVRRIFHDLILAFIGPGWRASGKPRAAEKTPWNLLAFPELRRLFPASPLIHVIRDGRDVVASRLERDRAAGVDADGPSLAAVRAKEWSDAMSLARRLRADRTLADRYYEVRYEALVRRPHEALAALFAFLGERFEAQVLEFHRVAQHVDGDEEWSAEAVRRPLFADSIGRWRRTLTSEEQAAVWRAAASALQELGYDD